jgi:hypothetical protein
VLRTVPVSLDNALDITGVRAGTLVVNAKASTNITYATTYSSVGVTNLLYKLRLRVEAL